MTDLASKAWARLATWEAESVVPRIWEKDPTVWAGPDTPEITNRLGWLDLPSRMRRRVAGWLEAADDIAAAGVTDIVLLGMGGSSLAPEVFTATVPSTGPTLHVLDTTHPDAIGALTARLEPATTVCVVSSKSGGTLETLSLFRHFWAWRSAAGLAPGPGFIAITDPGSGLNRLAAERGFRAVFEADPNVGGRFSALSDFGMVPVALSGGDPDALLAVAEVMEKACGPEVAATAHVGLDLGAWIGEAALVGRDKLTIVTSASLRSFPGWWEQLIAESTGKEGLGVVPVDVTDLDAPGAYGDDRLFLIYQFEDDPAVVGVDALEAAEFPVRVIHLQRVEEIASEMYRAEFAVAAVGAVLGINPFDQPDVEAAKESARELMEGGGAGGSSTHLTEAETLAAVRDGDYLAVMAFVPMTSETVGLLRGLADRWSVELGVPVTVGFGPRFLHSTGQLHKGGPGSCVALQVVDDPVDDLPIPETNLTFGQVIRAQADGDAAVLAARGRVVGRTQLESVGD